MKVRRYIAFFSFIVLLSSCGGNSIHFDEAEWRREVENQGIRLFATQISSLDLPAVSKEIAGVLRSAQEADSYTVIDLAGEPEGARVLGSYRDHLPQAYEFFLIFNLNRPFSDDLPRVLQWSKAISDSVRSPFTGVVNNTHLMAETGIETIEEGAKTSRKLAQTLGIPLAFNMVKQDLLKPALSLREPVFPIKLFIKPPWD